MSSQPPSGNGPASGAPSAAPASAPAAAPKPRVGGSEAPAISVPVSSSLSPTPAPADEEPRLSFTGLLRRALSSYEGFVAESAWYSSLLETAKTFSVFLPGRFSDTDLRGEFAYMGLNLLTFYHDGILGRPRSHASSVKLSGLPALITAREPRSVGFINAALFVLSSTECLIELATAQHYSKTRAGSLAAELARTPGASFQAPVLARFAARSHAFRMRSVVVIETLKFLLRLWMIYQNRGKTLLSSDARDALADQARRQADAATAAVAKDDAARARAREALLKEAIARARTQAAAAAGGDSATVAAAAAEAAAVDGEFVTPAAAAAPPTGAAGTSSATAPELASVSALTGASGADEDPTAARAAAALRLLYASHGRAQAPHGQFAAAPASGPPAAERAETVPPVTAVAAEVLYWARPVVYAWLKAKYGANAWTPLAASLVVDAIAYAMRGEKGMSEAQKAAWSMRKKLYLFYLLRSPVFDSVTVVPLQVISDIAQYIPIVGGFVSAIIEVGFNLQQNHFYTSAS